jgi:hypothetical protein
MKNLTEDILLTLEINKARFDEEIEINNSTMFPSVNNWTVIYCNKDVMKVKINFTNPLQISLVYDV